jgi:hypothetical protein
MKMLLLSFLLVPVFCMAQRDFDYTFYTTKARMPASVLSGHLPKEKQVGSGPEDSAMLELTLPRKIDKQADVLKIISLTNTGDCQTYTLQFLGMQVFEHEQLLVYKTDHNQLVYFNPLQLTISLNHEQLFY